MTRYSFALVVALSTAQVVGVVAQGGPGDLKDRGKHEPPQAKPKASEATLLDGSETLDTLVLSSGAAKTEGAAKSESPGTVEPSIPTAPTLRTSPLENDSSAALSPQQLEVVSQAREVAWRVDMVHRVDAVFAGRDWQGMQDAINDAPLTRAQDVLQDLLGAWAGMESHITTASSNGGRVVTGKNEPIQDTPSDSQSTASDSLSIEERAILFDARARGYEVPSELRAAGSTSMFEPMRDLRAWLQTGIVAGTARLEALKSGGSVAPSEEGALARARAASDSRRAKRAEATRGLAQANQLRDESEGDLSRSRKERDSQAKIDLPREALQSAVPKGWVICQCPDQHPGAGLLIGSDRWHTPALHCPQ